jgi:hypothetical protein
MRPEIERKITNPSPGYRLAWSEIPGGKNRTLSLSAFGSRYEVPGQEPILQGDPWSLQDISGETKSSGRKDINRIRFTCGIYRVCCWCLRHEKRRMMVERKEFRSAVHL